MRRTLLLPALPALLALLASGCSYVFMTPPPVTEQAAPVAPTQEIECTTANTAPILDAVAAGVGALVPFLIGPNISRFDPATGITIFAGGLAVSAAGAVSAVHGFKAAHRCRRFKRTRLDQGFQLRPPSREEAILVAPELGQGGVGEAEQRTE